MNYLQLLKQARTHGVTSEKKMWASIEQLSKDLDVLRGIPSGNDIYWRILRNQHAILYDRHYTEQYANYDVENLEYLDSEGKPCHGPHWTRAEIVEATKSMKFHSKVNDWDKYVAFNAMYADLCADMDDAAILKAAYLFYFCDKDWQSNDDCTKIWDYMTSHTTI